MSIFIAATWAAGVLLLLFGKLDSDNYIGGALTIAALLVAALWWGLLIKLPF